MVIEMAISRLRGPQVPPLAASAQGMKEEAQPDTGAERSGAGNPAGSGAANAGRGPGAFASGPALGIGDAQLQRAQGCKIAPNQDPAAKCHSALYSLENYRIGWSRVSRPTATPLEHTISALYQWPSVSLG
jgi:hypothetical protein